MSHIVKCEVCGGLYNESYLGSHKRLAHGKKGSPSAQITREPDAIEEILSLYKQLSNQGQKDALERLTALSEKSH